MTKSVVAGANWRSTDSFTTKLVPEVQNCSINQSINQTTIAPISPAKPGSVARQPN